MVKGQSYKKGVNPDVVQHKKLKYVKDIFCIDHLRFVHNVTNVPTVAPDLPVGARLHRFWDIWEALGDGPKLLKIHKEGYTLPFQNRPNLSKSPTIISRYAHPLRDSYLMEALHARVVPNILGS